MARQALFFRQLLASRRACKIGSAAEIQVHSTTPSTLPRMPSPTRALSTLTCADPHLPDLIGVLLFGTEESRVPNDHQGFPHIYMLQACVPLLPLPALPAAFGSAHPDPSRRIHPKQDLNVPSAAEITALNRLLDPDEAHEFGHASVRITPPSSFCFQHTHSYCSPAPTLRPATGQVCLACKQVDNNACDFANVLWVTSMLFSSCNRAKNTRRRVYLITNNDNPTADAHARSRALTRGNDLQDAHIWLEPFFFAPPAPATFDLSEGSFWRELVGDMRSSYRAAPDVRPGANQRELVNPEDASDGWVVSSVCAGEGELLNRVKRRAQRKRVLGQMELRIRDDLKISGATRGKGSMDEGGCAGGDEGREESGVVGGDEGGGR